MKQALKLRNSAKSSVVSREETYKFYLNKYFNLFMNAYKWTGIDDQQKDYLMRRFWTDGKIATFKLDAENEKHPNGLLVFCPYANVNYNLYDFPIDVTLVNVRGVPFIPAGLQRINKDVVIGYAQRNKKPVFLMVDYYLKRITDVEMTIRTNLKAHKMPWLVGVTPESENKMRQIVENMEKDEPYLFLDLDEAEKAKSLISGANYIVDKLYAQKCALENELKEYLGFNNMGVTEKKEHLINSEVESNNELIESSANCFLDSMKEFCGRVKEVFNYNFDVELAKIDIEEASPEDEQEFKAEGEE